MNKLGSERAHWGGNFNWLGLVGLTINIESPPTPSPPHCYNLLFYGLSHIISHIWLRKIFNLFKVEFFTSFTKPILSSAYYWWFPKGKSIHFERYDLLYRLLLEHISVKIYVELSNLISKRWCGSIHPCTNQKPYIFFIIRLFMLSQWEMNDKYLKHSNMLWNIENFYSRAVKILDAKCKNQDEMKGVLGYKLSPRTEDMFLL